MTRARFEKVVRSAIERLPKRFLDALNNIAIVIEDRPGPRNKRCGRKLLLGLYEGVPLNERAHDYLPEAPDRITIFQKNIEKVCSSEKEMTVEIRKTVLHEIGHYFGLTEQQLKRLGY